MYKVLCDGALMCDSRVQELALIDPVVTLEENKVGSFTFTIPPKHPMYDAIKRRTTLVQVYQDDETEPLFSGVCIKDTCDFYNRKKISCEGELTFFNDSVQRPARYEGMSIRGLMEAYIANHNAQVEEKKHFTVGIVTVTDSNDYISCYTNMETTMKALKEDLVDDLGGFLRVRHSDGVRYLDYLADSLNTNSQPIRIGENLLDFTRNIDSSDIATAIIPRGAKLEESTIEGLEERLSIESVNDGVDYVYSQEAVNTYGWIYKTVEFDEVTTPEALKSKGEKYLSDIQWENMVIEAKAIDLHLTDKDIERFKISDQIHVVSSPHGLDRYFRLTKMTIRLNNPENSTITLGKKGTVSLSAKTNQENAEIKKAIERIVPADIIQSAVANASQLIKNSMNGYITTVTNEDGTPKELLIMDTPDTQTATKVWRWNINGLGYSSTGYDGEYGLALTMDGHFVADAITVDGLEVGKNVKMGKDATISWEQVTDKDSVPTEDDIPSDDYITKIARNAITAAFIKTLNLVVGNEISMGENATITWEQVEGTDNVALLDDIPSDDYITEITRNAITSAFIKTLNLAVGNEITMGENATIAWGKVTGTDGVASKTDIPSDAYITQITKNTVTAEYINALKVIAASVAAENLTGEKIEGKQVVVDDEEVATRIYVTIRGGTTGKKYSVYIAPDRILLVDEGMAVATQIRSHLISGSPSYNTSSMNYYINASNGNAYFGGTLYTASGTVSKSDEDAKNSIESLDKESVTDFIYSLRPVRFKYNSGTSDRYHHGLIAQEVKKTMGDEDWGLYVDEDPTEPGNKGIRYEELISDLISVVQSQNERIKILEERAGILNE